VALTRVTRARTPAATPSARSGSPGGTASLGQRARNKLQKRDRIRAAVHELFSARGFERTTLRDIASLAEVGLGTLFSYAQNKGDLTFLLFSDDLSRLVDESVAASGRKASLLEQVMATWELHYRFFAKDAPLSRVLLRDMYFYMTGTEAERFQQITARLREHLLDLVRRSQAGGHLARDASSSDIAAMLFSVYESSVRSWLADDTPSVTGGLTTLRRRLAFLLRAFVPMNQLAAMDGSSSTPVRTSGTRKSQGGPQRVATRGRTR
jgi:AcrR family transcriptional regulator